MPAATLKLVMVVVIFGGVALFIRGFVYERYRCQLMVVMEVRDQTQPLDTLRDRVLVAIRARDNLARLAPCLERTPWDVRLQMLAGGNHALREDHASAAEAFEAALRYDRRPETHFALGVQLMHLARTDEAVRHLVTACVVNPEWVEQLPEPIRGRVNTTVTNIRRGRAR